MDERVGDKVFEIYIKRLGTSLPTDTVIVFEGDENSTLYQLCKQYCKQIEDACGGLDKLIINPYSTKEIIGFDLSLNLPLIKLPEINSVTRQDGVICMWINIVAIGPFCQTSVPIHRLNCALTLYDAKLQWPLWSRKDQDMISLESFDQEPVYHPESKPINNVANLIIVLYPNSSDDPCSRVKRIYNRERLCTTLKINGRDPLTNQPVKSAFLTSVIKESLTVLPMIDSETGHVNYQYSIILKSLGIWF